MNKATLTWIIIAILIVAALVVYIAFEFVKPTQPVFYIGNLSTQSGKLNAINTLLFKYFVTPNASFIYPNFSYTYSGHVVSSGSLPYSYNFKFTQANYASNDEFNILLENITTGNTSIGSESINAVKEGDTYYICISTQGTSVNCYAFNATSFAIPINQSIIYLEGINASASRINISESNVNYNGQLVSMIVANSLLSYANATNASSELALNISEYIQKNGLPLNLELYVHSINYSVEAEMSLVSYTESNSSSITAPSSFTTLPAYKLMPPNATINYTTIETQDEEFFALYATNPQPNFMHYVIMTELAYTLANIANTFPKQ